jgi:hypothetical protein
MKSVAAELKSVVEEYAKKFSKISDSEFSAKPLPNKWSGKEVIGHLIDSAQNNLRRFIVGQYESNPPKITYEQDFWVNVNSYQQMSSADIIALWKLINERIVAVLTNMPEKNYNRNADTGKMAVQLHTLQFLAEDYVQHLKHHINQVIPNSFDIIYK